MQTKFKEKLSGWIASAVFGLLYLTYRFPSLDDRGEALARTMHPNSQVAIAIWHRNAIGCLLTYARRRLAILVSLSFDGEVIARVARFFGVHSARGSSSRGGKEAFKQLITLHKQGYDLGITVDGPRGPRYKVKPGILAVASRTGTPVLPFAAVADREWVLHRSWDHFRIPKPFAKIWCAYGEPIVIPRGTSDLERWAKQLEVALMILEERLAHHIAGSK
jgi:lysophospholipid acyltransferase (LPLAT)-like uncharacterized protein